MYRIDDDQQDGFPTLTLRTPDGSLTASFAPGLAMLGCSLRHHGEELLHLDNGLEAYARAGKTRGIPLLHPWANRLAEMGYRIGTTEVAFARDSPGVHIDGNGLAIHGLLGGSHAWDVEERSANAEQATLQAGFTLDETSPLFAAFPFAHRLQMVVRLDARGLSLRTTLTPTAADAVPVSFGFHPYFLLPGEARATWRVALPVRRHLQLDDRMIPTGTSQSVEFPLEPLGARTFDDGFAELIPGAPFVLAGTRRTLRVHCDEGYTHAQVYAPAGRDFICFEPMTAPTNALRSGDGLRLIPPGTTFTATWRITVSI